MYGLRTSGSIVFMLVTVVCTLQAQNLVPNGSFEQYASCPGSYNRRPGEVQLPSWRILTTGSPDFYNECSNGEASVPYNWAGISYAFEGKGFAGIYTWLSLKEYREYLHCKLTEPLMRDSLYRIEFRYKLASYAKYCTDRIAVLLSDSIAPVRHDRRLQIPPTLSFVKDSVLTPETGMWEEAVAEFRAKGGEQFLTIGNFADDSETGTYFIRFRPAQEPMLADAAYYYIDDVRLTPLFGLVPLEEPKFFDETDPRPNTVYILRNIRFAFNSYELMSVSFGELDKVAEYMRRHPDVKLRLSGHTDDIGDPDYNMQLSVNRARSTAAYLVSRGIDSTRIVTRGYGETKPLSTERSDEARRTNRRVEIEFFR